MTLVLKKLIKSGKALELNKKVQSKIIGGNVYGCSLGEECGQGSSYHSDNGPSNHNDNGDSNHHDMGNSVYMDMGQSQTNDNGLEENMGQ